MIARLLVATVATVARVATVATLAITCAAGIGLSAPAIAQVVQFSSNEISLIKSLGPWPTPVQRDVSNALSGNAKAIALGQQLFSYAKLSSNQSISCKTCHQPARGFSDGLALSQGLKQLHRNSQSLWNLQGQRWFGWDGASDSLWLHSLKPMLHPDEMNATFAKIARVVRSDKNLLRSVAQLPLTSHTAIDDELMAITVAKSIAAYVETLASPRTAFDDFRDALVSNNRQSVLSNSYPQSAQRGLQLFVGKGNCISCHAGPSFTNGEFADNGVGHFRADRSVDPGRHEGLQKVLADKYNLLGRFSDAPPSDQTHTRFAAQSHALFGQFKVPGLRELVTSGPYMHHGKLKTLKEVVIHYSTVSPDRLHSDGEKSLKAAQFSPQEIEDMVAFLQSLSGASQVKVKR